MPKRPACDGCRKKKIHCDRVEPRCDWCEHHNELCTYSRANGRKLSTARCSLERPSDYQSTIYSPHSWKPNRHSVGVTAGADTGTGPVQQALPKNIVLDDAWCLYYNGLPFFGHGFDRFVAHDPNGSRHGLQRTQDRSKDRARFQSPAEHQYEQPHMSLLPSHSDTARCVSTELPCIELVLKILEAYCRSTFRFAFPVIDPVLFRKTVNNSYHPTAENAGNSQTCDATKSCVLAFLSMITWFPHAWPTKAKLEFNRDYLAARALRLAVDSVPEATLPLSEAFVMLCIHFRFAGESKLSSFCHATACRLVFLLNGHVEVIDPTLAVNDIRRDIKLRTKHHLREVFWLCLVYDKEIALCTGQPPSIDEDQCRLDFPSGYLHPSFDDSLVYVQDAGTKVGVTFPRTLEITLILSRAHRKLCSLSAKRMADSTLLQNIRELDAELESWRLALPSVYRPLLVFGPDSLVGLPSNISERMRVVLINLQYYHLMAIIHGSCGRCQAHEATSGNESEGLRLSLQLCLAASRSSLHYLTAICNQVPCESLWVFSHFVTSAAVPIFGSVMSDVLGAHVQKDMSLLKTIPSLSKAMRFSALSDKEILYMDMLDNFVAQLIRRAVHAINKATDRSTR